MNKRVYSIIVISLGILAIASILLFAGKFQHFNAVQNSDSQKTSGRTIQVNEDNLASYLSSLNLIHELPRSALISLRTDKEYYTIRKGSVIEGKAASPDISVYLPSKYVSGLGDFCPTLFKALSSGDLRIELHMSKAIAILKYAKMYKYKGCLG